MILHAFSVCITAFFSVTLQSGYLFARPKRFIPQSIIEGEINAFLMGFKTSERLPRIIVMEECGKYSEKDLKLHRLNDRTNAHLNIPGLRFLYTSQK